MVNAIDRSGLTGCLMEVNAMSERISEGRIGLSALTGKPISRYASRNWLAAALGPTAGLLGDTRRITGGAIGDWTEPDTRALRRLIPYNNVFYWRTLFDRAENGVNNFFGVPRTAR